MTKIWRNLWNKYKIFQKKSDNFLLIILISFFSGVLGSLTILQLNQKQETNTQNSTTITQTAVKNENSTTKAVDKVKDAVVSIITYSANSQNSLFGYGESDTDTNTEQVSSQGSGVIYKKIGSTPISLLILTLLMGLRKLIFVWLTEQKYQEKL